MDQSKSPPRIIPFLVRYGIATLLVAAALGATLLISLVITSIASPLFLLAIVITAWRYGMRPGIFATLLSGVAIDIASKAAAGTNHFEIRLDPPELGKIEIRLDVDKDGNVKKVYRTVDVTKHAQEIQADVSG